MLDEVIIFNTALEETNIQTLMENDLTGTLNVEPKSKLATTWDDVKAE